LEWLKAMNNAAGHAFVQAIGEGTRQMLRVMTALRLPPPQYRLHANETVLTLVSNAETREEAMRAAMVAHSDEYGNLFLLSIRQGNKSG